MTGIAIDTSNGLVYVAGTSKSTLELFETYARTTFFGEMARMSPIMLAASYSEHPLEDAFPDGWAFSLSNRCAGQRESRTGIRALAYQPQDQAFLHA